MKKEFKTIGEQRQHLVNNKNVIDNEDIEKVLKERTYVSIINTYKEFFYTSIESEGRHVYEDKIDIYEYVNLASLDDYIANSLHKYVGIFERKLKFVIAYEYSKFLSNQKQDTTCTNYINNIKNISQLIDSENSDDNIYDGDLSELGFVKIYEEHSRKGKLQRINEKYIENTIRYRKKLLKDILLHSIQEEGIKRSDIIKHYIETQEVPPFWLLVHQLSLGELAVICGMLNSELRENIYINFKGIEDQTANRKEDINRFFLQIDSIKNIRNTINHYEPLIIKFKTFGLQKLEASLKLLKETHDASIIAKYKDYDISKIRDTNYNKDSKKIFEMFMETIK